MSKVKVNSLWEPVGFLWYQKHEFRHINLIQFHLLSLSRSFLGLQLRCSRNEVLCNTGSSYITLDHELVKPGDSVEFCPQRSPQNLSQQLVHSTLLTNTWQWLVNYPKHRYNIKSLAKHMINFNSGHQKHTSSSPHSGRDIRDSYAFCSGTVYPAPTVFPFMHWGLYVTESGG